MLEIHIRNNGKTTILELDGNVILGGGSARLRDAITKLVGDEKTDILLNFENVKYLDSSGTGEILYAVKSINDAGGSLKLTNLQPKVLEVLTLSSILPILEVYDREETALAETA